MSGQRRSPPASPRSRERGTASPSCRRDSPPGRPLQRRPLVRRRRRRAGGPPPAARRGHSWSEVSEAAGASLSDAVIRATCSVMSRARSCGVSPMSARISARLAWSRNCCGMPNVRTGHVDVGVAQQPGDRVADAADPAVVLDDGDQPVLAARAPTQRLVERLDPARVDDGDADALRVEQAGGLHRRRRHRARRRPAARRGRRRRGAARPSRRAVPIGLDVLGDRALGEAERRSGRRRPRRPRAAARAAGRRRAARRSAARARPAGSTGPTCRCGWRRRRR